MQNLLLPVEAYHHQLLVDGPVQAMSHRKIAWKDLVHYSSFMYLSIGVSNEWAFNEYCPPQLPRPSVIMVYCGVEIRLRYYRLYCYGMLRATNKNMDCLGSSTWKCRSGAYQSRGSVVLPSVV